MIRNLCLVALFLAGACSFPTLQDGFAPVENQIRLYYWIEGDGKEPYLFIPGACWLAEDLKALAADRTVVFYDARNRGYSSREEDFHGEGIDADVRDLEALRQFLGVKSMSLLGWADSANAVARYAAEYPSFVEKLILVNPLPPLDDFSGRTAWKKRLEVELKLAGTSRTDDTMEDCRAFFEKLLEESVSDMRSDPCLCRNEWPEELFDYLQRSWLPSIGNWDWNRELDQVAVPVRIIECVTPSHGYVWGTPASVRWLKGEQQTLSSCGLFPWLEEKEAFLEAIHSFLDMNEGGNDGTPSGSQ